MDYIFNAKKILVAGITALIKTNQQGRRLLKGRYGEFHRPEIEMKEIHKSYLQL